MKLFLLFALIFVISITSCVNSEPVLETGLPLALLSNDHPNSSLKLDPGVVIVSFQAYDPQEMQFNQYCRQSWAESSEIRMNSPYNGSLAFGIPEKNDCSINISGSGTWTAQVSRMEMNNPLKMPLNLSGSGTTVSPPFTLEKGNYIFQRGETGIASPMYELTFSNGTPLMDGNNTYIQPSFNSAIPDTFHIISIPEPGVYFLSVIAEDNPKPWNVSISSLLEVPVMGPGPVIRK